MLVTEDREEDLAAIVAPWRDKLRIRVVDRARPIHAKHNPVYEFLNIGALVAAEDWILTPAGDDSYFAPGWEWLLNSVDEKEYMTSIWVPRYLAVLPDPSGPRRVRCGEFGLSEFHLILPTETVDEATVRAEAASFVENTVVRERTGLRHRASWPHAVISRQLFSAAGLFGTSPPFPAAHDIALHNVFHARNTTSVGVNSSVIVNSRIAIRW